MLNLRVSDDLQSLVLLDYTEEVERKQLEISLTRKIHNSHFHPLVKKRLWTGDICFVDKKSAYWKIPIGLWAEVFEICEKYKLEVNIEGLERIIDSSLTLDEFTLWCKDFFSDKKFNPYDYQIKAAWNIIRFKYSVLEIATSSGKTLISFIVLAYLKKVKGINKFLMIVPNTTLIMQGADDFEEYGLTDVLDCELQMIHGGNKNKKPSGLMIGTYQSLVKQDESFFEGVEAVFVDECLHPESLVSMSNGDLEQIKNIRSGDLVYTINDITGEKEIKEVDYVYHNLSKGEQMYELEMDNGKILMATGNHKVRLSNGEWKRIDSLEEDDILWDI